MANNIEKLDDNNIDLSRFSIHKQVCIYVGYITKQAVMVEPGYNEKLQNKILKNVTFFNQETLNKIYVSSVKVLSLHSAIDDRINFILEQTSSMMIQILDDDSLSKTDVSYYYTIGLTCHELDVINGSIVLKK